MDKYVSNDMLHSLLSSNEIILFCPPWPSLRRPRRQIGKHTDMIYRFGFRRLDTGVPTSPSINSQWAPLDIYHNSLLPNKELCIVLMPRRPTTVTYIQVLHKATMRIYSFLHIPDIPVTRSNNYTPFHAALENERTFTKQIIASTVGFDIARAVDSDDCRRKADELIDSLADSRPDTILPLQGTIDGYYWKSPRHWLTVEPRLKQFHEEDNIFKLADVVLQIRNIVHAAFCAKSEATNNICEVFFCAALSSARRNKRTLPRLSLADMKSIVMDANDSLTVKALMCNSMFRKGEYNEQEFHPLDTLVSDPWLLFAIRNFLPEKNPLFSLLQKSQRVGPVDMPVVFTMHETIAEGTTAKLECLKLWTDTAVDITTQRYTEEGIEVVTITSPLVAHMDNCGILGRNVEVSGGIGTTHGQSQHTTTVILMSDAAYTYDDTLPFLIKICMWDNNELRGRLDSPMHMLESLLMDHHAFSDECTAEVL